MINRGKYYLWVGIGVATLLLLAGLCAYPIYLFWQSEWSGPYHNRTSVADLDGDGDLDVVLTNDRKENELIYWSDITLWRNRGGGYFVPDHLETPPYAFPAAGTGDMDDDGDVDILALSSDRLMLFRNQGGIQKGETGSFKPRRNNNLDTFLSVGPDGDTGTPGSPVLGDLNPDCAAGAFVASGSLVLGDLNQDCAPDAFVAGCCGMYLHEDHPGGNLVIDPVSWAWLNTWDRNGWLASNTVSLPELDGLRMREAALGDVNGDGSLDVYAAMLAPEVAVPDGAADRVLLNNGSGALSDSGQRLGDSESTSVALGDLDGDGDLDALVGTTEGAEVWVNQGGSQGGQAGSFARSPQEISGRPTSAVFLADLNGDGDQDALIAGARRAVIWWNDGQGAFTRSRQSFPYSERHGLAVADFNRDGAPDIFAAAYGTFYRVWFNLGHGIF